MSTDTLTATETELKLTPPDPVAAIQAERAAGLVPVADEVQTKLQEKVEGYINDLLAQDVNSPEFGKRVDQLTNMGRKEIMEAAGQSNRFLDRPIRQMDDQTGVGADLAELRRTVEDLDPSKRGSLTTKQKLFGIIPWGNKLRNYFDSYQSAQGHISAVLGRLANGKDELLMDNAAIDVERQNLWKAMGKLEQMIVISKQLDARLEEKAAELELSDPAKAKALRETALFYVRQRHQDLLMQRAVTVKGYRAMRPVKKNNMQLVKGVYGDASTLISALPTDVSCSRGQPNK